MAARAWQSLSETVLEFNALGDNLKEFVREGKANFCFLLAPPVTGHLHRMAAWASVTGL